MNAVTKKKAFTLIELLVVIAIIALLVSILLPSLNRARELAKRAICGANLNGVGKAIAMYKASNGDNYPFLTNGSNGGAETALVAASGISEPQDLAPNGTEALNPIENLNLLVESGEVGFKMFRCPSEGTETADRNDTDTAYGFKVGTSVYVDYGYHYGYTNWNSTTTNPAALTESSPSSLAIMADQPGDNLNDFGDGSPANTGSGYNHGDDGINVLYHGWNVSWEQSVDCGASDNNVYAADMNSDGDLTNGTSVGNPGYESDSVICDPNP